MNHSPEYPTETSVTSLKGRVTPTNTKNVLDKKKIIPATPKKKPKNENKKKKTHRCCFDGCRKKLNLIQQTKKCRCELMFCCTHYLFENHNCSFDYIAFSKNKIENAVAGGGQFIQVNAI